MPRMLRAPCHQIHVMESVGSVGSARSHQQPPLEGRPSDPHQRRSLASSPYSGAHSAPISNPPRQDIPPAFSSHSLTHSLTHSRTHALSRHSQQSTLQIQAVLCRGAACSRRVSRHATSFVCGRVAGAWRRGRQGGAAASSTTSSACATWPPRELICILGKQQLSASPRCSAACRQRAAARATTPRRGGAGRGRNRVREHLPEEGGGGALLPFVVSRCLGCSAERWSGVERPRAKVVKTRGARVASLALLQCSARLISTASLFALAASASPAAGIH